MRGNKSHLPEDPLLNIHFISLSRLQLTYKSLTWPCSFIFS